MAILGLGTDISEIERIKKALHRSGDALAERILTPEEMAVFSTLKHPERYLAKRFAVKEAASKALGTGIAHGVSFQDFITSNDEYGKPCLQVQGQAKIHMDKKGVNHVHVTISDERHYAVATVILES